MQSLLCVMPATFIFCQTMFPSVKEQPFMYLILLLTEHYAKGEHVLAAVKLKKLHNVSKSKWEIIYK